MDSLNRLKDYIPKDIPRLPAWSANLTNRSTNPDDDNGPSADSNAAEAKSAENEPSTMTVQDPIPIGSGPRSYLDLVNECDNFPYFHTNPSSFFTHINTYYGLYVKSYPSTPLGYILPSVAEVFRGLPDWEVDDSDRNVTLVTGSSEEERTKVIDFTTKAMKATDHFQVLKGWREELYPVFGPSRELLFSIERAASALFGIVTYGCHLTAYTKSKKENGSEDDREIKMWVPRRAAGKETYGGMLDNTVAGGIATGESPYESLVREAHEEASLPGDVVRRGAKSVGTVTYFHIRDSRAGGETDLLQPECQYVYDLELPADVVPKPNDGESEDFQLMTIDQVKEALRERQFKPNCALVILDFFVRHGIITEKDAGYIEIVARLHRRLEFPTQ